MRDRHTDTSCAAAACGHAMQSLSNPSQNLPGTKWRAALAALVAAPVRLHRYRNLHTEVLEDAIRAFDCRKCS